MTRLCKACNTVLVNKTSRKIEKCWSCGGELTEIKMVEVNQICDVCVYDNKLSSEKPCIDCISGSEFKSKVAL